MITAHEGCPMRDILDRVGDKWSALAVIQLQDGKLRFSDLRRAIEGILPADTDPRPCAS